MRYDSRATESPPFAASSGVLSFAKKCVVARLDTTCAVAVEFNLFSYRFVRRHLEHYGQLPVTLRQIDP
jgi:hypothetical protein